MVVASLDLKLVQLLRQAMQGVPGAAGTTITPANRIEPRPVVHPAPRIEPRPTIHPAPHFEDRLVYRPNRIEPSLAISAPTDPELPRTAKSPIQPPWKILPWQNPPPPQPKLKIVFKPPDLLAKGTIFDVFV